MQNLVHLKSVNEDQAIVYKIERMAELKKHMKEWDLMRKEHDAIKKELKLEFEGQEMVVVGDYEITGKIIKREEYVVNECCYWDMRIKKL